MTARKVERLVRQHWKLDRAQTTRERVRAAVDMLLAALYHLPDDAREQAAAEVVALADRLHDDGRASMRSTWAAVEHLRAALRRLPDDAARDQAVRAVAELAGRLRADRAPGDDNVSGGEEGRADLAVATLLPALVVVAVALVADLAAAAWQLVVPLALAGLTLGCLWRLRPRNGRHR